MIYFLTAFVLISLSIVVLFLVFAIDSLIGAHDLATSDYTVKALIEIIRREKPDLKIFYDLGCGRGTLALAIKKTFSEAEVCGLDKSPVRIFFARLKSKILRQPAIFLKRNIFEANLSQADVVYTYLWYDLMPPLEQKLQKELKPGALVITNTSHFPNWRPKRRIETCPEIFRGRAQERLADFETLFVYVRNGN